MAPSTSLSPSSSLSSSTWPRSEASDDDSQHKPDSLPPPYISSKDAPTTSRASMPIDGTTSPGITYPFPEHTRTGDEAISARSNQPSSSLCSKSSRSSYRHLPRTQHNCAHFADSLCSSRGSEEKAIRPPLPPSRPSLTPSMKWTRGPGFWRSFVAICIPLLLSALEGSVTNTALPTISDALDLGTMFSWVATAFLLASTIFQPLYGQLADMWGRKYPMMLAVGVFGIGSGICGWARSGAVLIFGRIVQGLGTGGIDLFAEMILCDLVPLRKRGAYMAIKHVVFAAGTTVGPLLGGVFAEHGWRWCFWINIPVCVFAIGMIWLWLQVGGGVNTKEVKMMEEVKKVDAVGTSLLTCSVVLVLVALSTGGASHPWSHPAITASLVIGLLGLVVFPFYERSKWCKSPIMPPLIFSNRTSLTAFSLTAIHGFITYGVQFYLPPFFQAVRGSSPTKSGIQVLPTTLFIVVLAAIGGPLLTFWGKYKPIHQAGFAFMTLGLGLCTMLTKDTSVGQWVMYQFLLAAGSGIIVSTLLPAVQVELPDTTNGASSGSWAFLRGTGSLFGVALPGAIFNLRFSQLLSTISNPTARSQLAHGQAYQRASSTFVGRFGEGVKEQIVHVFTESLKCVWIVFAVFAAIGFVLTFFERQVKMRDELNTAYGLKAPKSGPSTPKISPPSSGASTPVPESLESGEEKDLRKIASDMV